MNSNFTKLTFFIAASLVITLTTLDILSFSNGFTGVTKKDGGAGCVCHGFDLSPNISVFFTGPDSVAVGQTVLYTLKIVHGPAVTGGFDVATRFGVLDTTSLDNTLKRDTVRNELTHKFPKPFVNDTVTWAFKFKAPSAPQVDTLYAVGNSTDNNAIADTLDKWNFSPNFPVKIYIPIFVSNQNEIVKGYELYQNYPNPFNPTTKIRFDVQPSPLYERSTTLRVDRLVEGEKGGLVTMKIYDIIGKEVTTLVNERLKPGSYDVEFDASNLPSGVYFYELMTDGFSNTKKMVLAK